MTGMASAANLERLRGRKLPVWMSAALVLGELLLLMWLERRRPLRSAVESKPRREARNVALSAFTAMALQVTERPMVSYVTALVQRRRWGLFQRISFPIWLEVPLAVALMDYTLYVWHVLLHRVPVLWRFHLVHHVDLDLDTSTALRFHFGEMVLSVVWRGRTGVRVRLVATLTLDLADGVAAVSFVSPL